MTQRTPFEPKLMEDLLLGQIIEDAEQSRQIGCDPSVFLEIVQSHGPVEACKRMIESPVLGQGLLRLKQAGRLDLTVEALVLRDRFKRLFDQPTLATARKRLVDWSPQSLTKRQH
jgi:hypothetical protein